MAQRVCDVCGQPLDPNDAFCMNCGAKVSASAVPAAGEQACSACGAPLQPGDAFCMNCGARVNMGSVEPVVVEPQQEGLAADGFCPECGGKTLRGWRFCLNCGQELTLPMAMQSHRAMGESAGVPVPVVEAVPPSAAFAPAPMITPIPTPTTTPVPVPATTQVVTAPNLDLGLSGAESLDASDFWDKTDAGFEPDDAPTTIYTEDDEDMDAPTMVYMEEPPTYRLIRRKTQESYDLAFPATVGKGSAASVRIAGSRVISRVHVKLYMRNGDVYLEDNASTNKTMVNGTVLTPGAPVHLQQGDVVTLADEEFDFVIG